MNDYLEVMLEPGAKMPVRGYENDAGLDIFANETKLVTCFHAPRIRTGVHVRIPVGCKGNLESKSGLMDKGITTRGTIDYGYTGEIKVRVFKKGIIPYLVRKGKKITQLTIVDCYKPIPIQVTKFPETERGDKGFGSTGL